MTRSFWTFATNRFTVIGLLVLIIVLMFPFGRAFRFSTFGGTSRSIEATLSESFETISELNTLRVSMAGVVSSSDESFWGDNNVLIVAQGYAVYGVDLSLAKIEVSELAVKLTLPTPTMNEAYLDMDDSYVYENEVTGLRLHDSKQQLVNATWNEAQNKIISLSLQPRNLAMAKTNLNALVKGLVQPHIGGRTMIIEYK